MLTSEELRQLEGKKRSKYGIIIMSNVRYSDKDVVCDIVLPDGSKVYGIPWITVGAIDNAEGDDGSWR